MQLGMLRHVRLHEHGTALGIKSRSQPVEQNFNRVFLHARRIGVIVSERMPVDKAEITFVLVLHAHPVLQRANIIAQMQFACRTHSAEHALTLLGPRCHQILKRMELKMPITGKISLPKSPPPKNTRAMRANIPTVS